MDRKGLMIGNLVKSGFTYHRIAALSLNGIESIEILNDGMRTVGILGALGVLIEPIPITAEWLLRLGFKEYHSTNATRRFESAIFDDLIFHISATNYVVVSRFFVKCEYVHELQNIVFVLKGKCLTPQ